MIDQLRGRVPGERGGGAHDRLAMLARELAPQAATAATAESDEDGAGSTGVTGAPGFGTDWTAGRAGRLVERWLPGGTRAVDGARSVARNRRGWTVAALLAVVAAVCTTVVVSGQQPAAEQAPPLPAAVSVHSAAPAPAANANANAKIVVSVVGRVLAPGLVNLPAGSRVADAIRAAGGPQPGADLSALNLARKLADGEQIYAGIPIPAGAAADDQTVSGPSTGGTDTTTTPTTKGKKGSKKAGTAQPGQKVNLNTATADELETLPGVGPATAQRIVDWRSQHGQFGSIDQLRQVGGIGDAKFAKLQDLVTV